MKRSYLWRIAYLTLFALLVFLGYDGKNTTSPVVKMQSTPMSVAFSIPSPSASVSGELVRVVRVVDGDTIEIEGGKKVRYIGIDTPETVDPRKQVQCFGKEASVKNKELVEGKLVRMEKDISEKDKYGRLLRYVYVDDVFVNEYLVRQGYAYSYSYPPDISKQDVFLAAQNEAMENNRGLWAGCAIKNGML